MKKAKTIYVFVKVVVVLAFILSVYSFFFGKIDEKEKRLFNAVQSFLMLLCTFVPSFIECKGKVVIPDIMKNVFICFCFAHFIVGEVCGLYVQSKVFDSILHAFSGAMIAMLGFSIIKLLNNCKNGDFPLSPLLAAVFAVCFSVAVGVAWEMIEFLIDNLTGSNMQRYSDSITREPFFGNKALLDTMKDLILDSIGAIAVAIMYYMDFREHNDCLNSKWCIEIIKS